MDLILLAAGAGSRLGGDTPKALVAVRGKTLLDRVIDRSGASHIVVVTGYNHDQFEHYRDNAVIDLVYNPFWETTANIVSLCLGALRVDGDFLVVNGDTAFASDVYGRVWSGSGTRVAVSRKHAYDADDMTIHDDRGLIAAVAKGLPQPTGEACGLVRADHKFHCALERLWKKGHLGRHWPHVMNGVLGARAVEVAHDEWCEIDTPDDVQRMEDLGL